MMRLEHYEKTDVGKKRSENQDSYGVSDTENFFVVCDGMGGGAAGDFASQLSVDIILKAFRLLGPKDIRSVLGEPSISDSQEALKPLAAIRLANRALKNFSDKFTRLSGMGTTSAAVFFDKKKGIAHIYNVGDSRVYRIRNGRIEQLTKDHTKVSELVEAGKMRQEEVKNAEIQSMLTRALGTQLLVRIDYRAEYIKPNDCYIICSDGINGELEDSTIRDIAYINKDSAESLAKELIYAANNAGGRDNLTVVVVNVDCSDYVKMPVIDEKLEKVLAVEEETLEQSYAEDRLLKKILPRVKVRVPDIAKDRNIFKNPVYIGAIVAVLFLAAAFLFVNARKNVYEKGLGELTGEVSGIKLDVRSPSEAQIAEFQKSNDQVIRLQMIQDWLKDNGSLTLPMSDVYVTVNKGHNEEEYTGISGLKALAIELPKGNHEVSVRYPGYKIITDKMEFKDSVNISLEFGDTLRPVILIIVPEKLRARRS